MIHLLKSVKLDSNGFRYAVFRLMVLLFVFVGITAFLENLYRGFYLNLIADFFVFSGAVTIYLLHRKGIISYETASSSLIYLAFFLIIVSLVMYTYEVKGDDFYAIFYWFFPLSILSYILKSPEWSLLRNLIFLGLFSLTVVVLDIFYRPIEGWHTFFVFFVVYLVSTVGLYFYAKYVYSLQSKIVEKHRKILESENKFKTLAENAPIGIVIKEDGKVSYINSYLLPIKREIEKIVDREDFPSEVKVDTENGEKTFLISVSKLNVNSKEIRIITFTDISEEKELREKINESKQFFETITEKSPIGIIIYRDKIEYVNQKFLDTLGYKQEEVIGRNVLDFIPEDYPEIKKILMQAMEKRFRGELSDQDYVIPVLTKSGSVKWLYLTAHSISYDSQLKGLAIVIDITEKKRLEERVFTLENLDLDTGLPNRSILLREVDFLTKQKNPFAVIIVDINGFVEIKKIYGEEIAKELLRKVKERLMNNIPNIMLGKIGMDKFVIVKTFNSKSEIREFIHNKLMRLFNTPFDIKERRIPVSVNIGVSIFPDDGQEAGKLCSNAEFALKMSKLKGRKEIQFFSEEERTLIESKLDLIKRLNEALEKREFEILYQPKVYIKDMRFAGCEALLRWEIPPNEFIPVLSETKMLSLTHQLIFGRIFKQIREWIDKGLSIKVAINIPFPEIEKEGFLRNFVELKDKYNVPSENITIEITETEIMKNPERSIDIIKQLKSKGFSIAIDDFGIGYSSLSYLTDIPADELKIDIAFVRKLPNDEKTAEIVKIIVEIGKILGMEVTAEGVETEEQWNYLKLIGCDIAQGFYISKPLKPKELEEFYRNHI